MDEGLAFPRHPRFRLSKIGYSRLCGLLDERDGYHCIICNATTGLHHHHVVFRSALGGDREDNMVVLCANCHDIWAHGTKEKRYRAMFQEYLESPHIVEWRKAHWKELEAVYKLRWRKKW